MRMVRAVGNIGAQTPGRPGLALGYLFISLITPPLFAVSPNPSMGQYLHTSWTQKDGSALPQIQAIAQAADGYLWLGTGKGLMRFDGMRFTDWSPASGPGLPSLNVVLLRPASAGGLWVGTTAGLCRVDRGRVIRYPALGKLPCPMIVTMAEDRLGRPWLLNVCPKANTLALLSPEGTLRTFGIRDGLPDKPPQTIIEDRQGNIWIGTAGSICRWSPGSAAVCYKVDVAAMAENANGELMIADREKRQVFRLSGGQPLPVGPHLPDSALSKTMICDHDGNIWIGTMGQGLLRVTQDSVDRYRRNEGLSNNTVFGLTEDREGDIWVATARGVDRIRDPKVQVYSTQNGLSSDVINSVYGGQDGAVWIGGTGGLNRLAGERVTVRSRAEGLPDPTVLSLYRDGDGKMSVATVAGLARQDGDRFVEVLTASGQHLRNVFNISGNGSGEVWLADVKLGLFAVRGGVAHPVAFPDSGSSDIASLLVARNGSVWLGNYGGGITVLLNESAKHYDSRDGLGNGPVRALYQDRDGSIWAGTGAGLSRFRDSHWTTWTTSQGLPEGGVQGIVGDETGGLWLLTPAGVLNLPSNCLDSPGGLLQPTLFGSTEGLRLGNGMTNPRLTRSRDGRVWVCTEDGVAAIDPMRVKRNPIPPPVAIEQVIADGKTCDPYLRSETAFRGHDLQIVYTGISLMVPERVRFRYRLEGLGGSNTRWTDAGTRRNVAYMNLPPGHYKFQVTASNNDGLWNTAGADFALRVDPYFYQTKWFALLCLICAMLMVWSAHRLKMRRVVSRLQLIAAERTRFSRELHDSLLQGFSGVVFLLEAASRQFSTAPELSKQRLDRAVDQADRSLREAREMIASMRIPALENHTLAEALRTTVEPMVSGIEVDLQFQVKGRPQQAPYNVEANLFMLAREAVTNALNHASPSRIRVELCYTPKELHLTVQDDGIGFSPDIAMAKAGHWGFRGMRERARVMGASFAVDSAPGRGATINVSVDWEKR
jgi:signal transduction histidine kinase/ligand-binding sensor domain-containing protein